MICAMQMARKIDPEQAYQMIKDEREREELKRCRKKWNKSGENC